MYKKILSLMMAMLLCLMNTTALADELPFSIRNGSREEKKVAITVDDCYEIDALRSIFELCTSQQAGVTIFPLGDRILMEDADLWKEIAASPYVEIGSHTQHHKKLTTLSDSGLATHLRRVQECLDEVLGQHYNIRSVRPPFGDFRGNDGGKRVARIAKSLGYDHIILWDVSQTDPDEAINQVKNGSILLYHARKKDYRCLTQLIPALKDMGYELVTVAELLGFEGVGYEVANCDDRLVE